MYNGLRAASRPRDQYACSGVPNWERRALPAVYPVVMRVIDRYLDITPATASESERAVRETFDEVAQSGSPTGVRICAASASARPI